MRVIIYAKVPPDCILTSFPKQQCSLVLCVENRGTFVRFRNPYFSGVYQNASMATKLGGLGSDHRQVFETRMLHIQVKYSPWFACKPVVYKLYK